MTSAPRGHDLYNRKKSNESNFFIEEFRLEFNSLWMRNKHIIMAIPPYPILNENNTAKVINGIVSTLPWHDSRYKLKGSNDKITAVVMYRSSRIGHLQSLWADSKKGTFSEWIASLKNVDGFDTFFVAEKLHLMGASIEIVDIDHLVKLQYTLSHYIACNLLGMPCDDKGYLSALGNKTITPMSLPSLPSRVEGLDLDQGKLEELDKVLREYDCGFDFLKDDNVQFFPTSLKETLSCGNGISSAPRKDLIGRISHLKETGN